MNIGIVSKKTTFLKKFELLHKLYKFCMIEKQYCTPFYFINQIDFFKYVMQKGEFFLIIIKSEVANCTDIKKSIICFWFYR